MPRISFQMSPHPLNSRQRSASSLHAAAVMMQDVFLGLRGSDNLPRIWLRPPSVSPPRPPCTASMMREGAYLMRIIGRMSLITISLSPMNRDSQPLSRDRPSVPVPRRSGNRGGRSVIPGRTRIGFNSLRRGEDWRHGGRAVMRIALPCPLPTDLPQCGVVG